MKSKAKLLACAAAASVLRTIAASAQTVTLAAAGSLEAALGEAGIELRDPVQDRSETASAEQIAPKGIEEGDRPELFALSQHGPSGAACGYRMGDGPMVLFARYQLHAWSAGTRVSSDTLLDALLRPDLRVGTSTPKADRAGTTPGRSSKRRSCAPAASRCSPAKALQLTGGAESDKAPKARTSTGG